MISELYLQLHESKKKMEESESTDKKALIILDYSELSFLEQCCYTSLLIKKLMLFTGISETRRNKDEH